MSKVDPKLSEGARLERAAFRTFLKREIKQKQGWEREVYLKIHDWVLERQKRYNKKEGGLGRN